MKAPYNPYASDVTLSVEDRVTQIRHLAVIGLAATNSTWNIRRPLDCFVSLFEVIARLADEIEDVIGEDLE